MGQEIAISVTREETRVAVLDNGVMTDLYVDRAKQKDFVGNIYIGKVVKVLPGMQAAFIDVGLERTAFLHASDIAKSAYQEGETGDGVEPVLGQFLDAVDQRDHRGQGQSDAGEVDPPRGAVPVLRRIT